MRITSKSISALTATAVKRHLWKFCFRWTIPDNCKRRKLPGFMRAVSVFCYGFRTEKIRNSLFLKILYRKVIDTTRIQVFARPLFLCQKMPRRQNRKSGAHQYIEKKLKGGVPVFRLSVCSQTLWYVHCCSCRHQRKTYASPHRNPLYWYYLWIFLPIINRPAGKVNW